MPPIKKYTTSISPTPCTGEQKAALENLAAKLGIKPANLHRQIFVYYLVSAGELPACPEEYPDLQTVREAVKIAE